MTTYRWIPPAERDSKGTKWIQTDDIPKDPNSGLNGPVYCPETGYYDPVLNQRFETKRQKREYMRTNKLRMDGSDKRRTMGKGPKISVFMGN